MTLLRRWFPECLLSLLLCLWIQSHVLPLRGWSRPIHLTSEQGYLTIEIGAGHGGVGLPIPYWLPITPMALWILIRQRNRWIYRRKPRHPGICPCCSFQHAPSAQSCPACGAIFPDAARCPICRYDLRATPGRCPECGWGSASD